MDSSDPSPHDWALVLAGGRGRRIAHLTRTDAGVSVPKQFCSLGRGSSLVHEALRRARAVAPPERILVTVTESHRPWWQALREVLPAENLLVQPRQRGTGIGILHPLLEVLRRDTAASVAILPSDHYFGNESGIKAGLRMAMRLARQCPDKIVLLGFDPEEPDTDLGYVVPCAASDEALCGVSRFVEKPGADRVRALIDEGALCNSFILAANAHALLALFERRCPAAVAQLRRVVDAAGAADQRILLAKSFEEIPSIDFSREIITADIGNLSVLRLPDCGWSDLGTPARLDRVLRRHGEVIASTPPATGGTHGHVDLAARSPGGQRGRDSNASSLRS